MNFNNNNNCVHCHALLLGQETSAFCCLEGRIKLNSFPTLPEFLHKLYFSEDDHSEMYLENIRRYNMLFSMTIFLN